MSGGGEMNKWMDGWAGRHVDGRMAGCVDGWKDGWMGRGCIVGLGEWMDRWGG
jgi:hypothetical protein